jgi:hypothetical protein
MEIEKLVKRSYLACPIVGRFVNCPDRFDLRAVGLLPARRDLTMSQSWSYEPRGIDWSYQQCDVNWQFNKRHRSDEVARNQNGEEF